MEVVTVPLGQGAYTEESPILSAQDALNMYYVESPAVDPGNSTFNYGWYPTPGSAAYKTLSATGSQVRAVHENNGNIYAVVDNTVYKVSTTGTITNLGTIGTSYGDVVIADNTLHALIADGNASNYTINLSTDALEVINDVNYPGFATSVCENNGYLVISSSSNKVWHSALYDARTWSIASRQAFYTYSGGGNLKAVASQGIYLFAIGEFGIEVLTVAETVPFAFAKNTGIKISKGSPSVRGSVIAGETLYTLANTKGSFEFIRVSNSGQAEVISPPAISQQINDFNTVADCVAYRYFYRGYEFVRWIFPAGSATYDYNIKLNRWSRVSTGDLGRHISHCYCNVRGRHIIGDFQSGKLYEMSGTYYTDNGLRITRKLYTPNFRVGTSSARVNYVTLIHQPGVGTVSTDTTLSDPQVSLELSEDGGQSWWSAGNRDLGQIGQRLENPTWNKLGVMQGRSLTAGIVVTDARPFYAYVLEIGFDKLTR